MWGSVRKTKKAELEEKNLAKVNNVLKVRFENAKTGVEKTHLFLCKVYENKERKIGEMPCTDEGGEKRRKVNKIYFLQSCWWDCTKSAEKAELTGKGK